MRENNTLRTATFAGGCFWCTEALFRQLKGVESVRSGYAGGKKNNPTYEQVSTGVTGHTEAVQIIFNPQIIPYGKLLEIFFHIHNPTTLNQQGADIGTQYRSAIFYHNEEQKKQALNFKGMLNKSEDYQDPVVTEIIPFKDFYPAEEYHQNYYDKNLLQPYCQVIIKPKLQKLLKDYAKDVK